MTQREIVPSPPTATSHPDPAPRRPRRTWLVPVLAVIGVALVAGVLMVPVDAVIQSPGPTWNVLAGVNAEGVSAPLPSDVSTPDGPEAPSGSSGTTPQPASSDVVPQAATGSPASQAESILAGRGRQAGALTDQGEASASALAGHAGDMPEQVRPLIAVTGAPTYPASGALRMTTVSVRGCPGYPVTAWDVLRAWLSHDEVVVDREAVCPRSMSAEEVEEVNQAQMSSSEDSAVTAALAETGLATRQTLTITGVARQQTAAVRSGDVIAAVSVAGQATPVETYAGLRDLLRTLPAGTQIALDVLREGQVVSVPLTTLAPDNAAAESEDSEDTDGAGREGGSGSLLGVLLQVEADSPIKATFALQDVGGPSAGMMFALGIVDTLTPGDLTGGKDVAGTGTMSPDGTVGPIGGIAQKMAGAAHDGATYFLAPADNCAEVVGHEPQGMKVFAVSTLHEAVQATGAIAQGNTDSLEVCHQ